MSGAVRPRWCDARVCRASDGGVEHSSTPVSLRTRQALLTFSWVAADEQAPTLRLDVRHVRPGHTTTLVLLPQEVHRIIDRLGTELHRYRFLSARVVRDLPGKPAGCECGPVAAGPVEDQGSEDEVIPVELAGTTKLVPRSSVRYVQAQGDYARLHTVEGSHLVRIPLSQLEDRWSDAGFVRIHRSFLVALPLVTELRMSGNVVRVGSGADAGELPVSRRRTPALAEALARGRVVS